LGAVVVVATELSSVATAAAVVVGSVATVAVDARFASDDASLVVDMKFSCVGIGESKYGRSN
jgi:hypothetical protein